MCARLSLSTCAGSLAGIQGERRYRQIAENARGNIPSSRDRAPQAGSKAPPRMSRNRRSGREYRAYRRWRTAPGSISLTAGGSRASKRARARFRRRTAHRAVGKPTGNIVALGFSALHDLLALGEHPPPISRQVPERLERSLLAQQARPHHHDIASRNREPVASVQIRSHILDAHKKPVLHRVHVDLRWQRAPVAWKHVANVVAARERSVKATPAHQLCPPCDVRILAIDEEVGVEELATYRDVLNHLPPVKRRSRRGPENILEAEVVPVINLLTAAIQVPQHRGKVDTSGINQLFFRKIEAGADSEELAADGPDLGIDLSCIHQRLNEIRQQQHVRVERQNPLPMR